MRVSRGVALVGALAILLDLLVVVLLALDFRASAALDATRLASDGGLSWRSLDRPLHGSFITANADGAWTIGRVEAVLTEDAVPLRWDRSAHDDIRTLGQGRWSLWQGQVYFSTSDGSDPTTNGRRYELTAPRRPTALLVVLASICTLAAFIGLRRQSAAFMRGSDAATDLLFTRFVGGGPHPLHRLAPWLLASAVVIIFTSPSKGEWFAWDGSSATTAFIPPYLGWSDAWIAAALLLTMLSTRVVPDPRIVGVLAVATLCLVGGGIDRADELGWRPQITGLVLGARFSLAFLTAWCLVRAQGVRAMTPAVAAIGAIWMAGVVASALEGRGQFLQVGGHFPSFAGMVLGVVLIFSVHRGAWIWSATALVCLIASGSRTAFIAAPLALLLPALRFGRAALPMRHGDASTARIGRMIPAVTATAIIACGVAAIASSHQLRSYLALKLSGSHWLSFGRRLHMTQWVFATLAAGSWHWLGWGCGRAPAFIDRGLEIGTMPEDWGNLHVIWLEWLVELGILAVPLTALVLWRAVTAWWRGPIAASMWLLFLLSQSMDYWLWSRDGMMLWGLFLGMAEGMAQRTRSMPR